MTHGGVRSKLLISCPSLSPIHPHHTPLATEAGKNVLLVLQSTQPKEYRVVNCYEKGGGGEEREREKGHVNNDRGKQFEDNVREDRPRKNGKNTAVRPRKNGKNRAVRRDAAPFIVVVMSAVARKEGGWGGGRRRKQGR
jgi:hypothetical protein